MKIWSFVETGGKTEFVRKSWTSNTDRMLGSPH